MIDFISSINSQLIVIVWTSYYLFLSLQILDDFQLIQALPTASESIFGFAEFLSALALFLVVISSSDFRYKYRLSLTSINHLNVGFWVSTIIGLSILMIDVWFENNWPVPKLFNNSNNLKAFLGLIFLILVFKIIFVAFLRKPVFSKANAQKFLDVTYHYIHEGNQNRIQIIAEELAQSIEKITACAAKIPKAVDGTEDEKIPLEYLCAAQILYLLGDQRFCRVVIDRNPMFALFCFEDFKKYEVDSYAISAFVHNIGQEFIRNTESSFYQEDSNYYSGLIGEVQPATSIIFGSHEFIQKCTLRSRTPLDIDYKMLGEFNKVQMEGFSRASLAYVKSYLTETYGSHPYSSNALIGILNTFENKLRGAHNLNGLTQYFDHPDCEFLYITLDFIQESTKLAEEHAELPWSYRMPEHGVGDFFDVLANLVMETIKAAAYVSSPEWTAWSVQHNMVWSNLLQLNSKASKIIALKVRRLIYIEITKMNDFPNFSGGRLLGFCLNVLGLTLVDRHNGFRKEVYPLQAFILQWTKANFKRIHTNNPQVAESCLQGFISYDIENNRLIRTSPRDTSTGPKFVYFDLD